MTLGNRNHERFWIALITRFAFGMLFLIAAINIFGAEWNPAEGWYDNVSKNLNAFTEGLSKPYASTFINFKSGEREWGIEVVKLFLGSMPFIFGFLSILLLTGIFYRLALRAGALLLVILGLGKYLTDFKTGNVIIVQDFVLASFIIIALYLLSKEPEGGGEPGR